MENNDTLKQAEQNKPGVAVDVADKIEHPTNCEVQEEVKEQNNNPRADDLFG